MAVFKKSEFSKVFKVCFSIPGMKLNKKEVESKIKQFFRDIENKKPEEIKKIKRLAMKHNIKLGNYRKKFCRYCFSPKLKVKQIKTGIKTLECEKCRKISRWRL